METQKMSQSEVAEENEDVRLSSTAAVEAVVAGEVALEALEQLQLNGELGREKASDLHRKYLLLKETLESSEAAEAAQLVRVKELEQVLTQQLSVLERCSGSCEGEGGEAERLRRILLTYTNQLEQSQQRLSTLETQLASVEEEHGQVNQELERQPRLADVEARVGDLQRQLEDLRDEIRKRSKDSQHYATEVESRELRLASISEQIEELKSTEEALQEELIQIRSAPGNLPREIDHIHKKYRDKRQEMSELESHHSELTGKLEEMQGRASSLEHQVREAAERLVEARDEGNRLHDQLSQAENSLAQAKERQVALLEQQASTELALRHRNSEHARLCESLTAMAKENITMAKQVKKAELQAEGVREAESQLLQRVERLQIKCGEGAATVSEWQQRQKEARCETEGLRKAISMQDGVSSAQRGALDERQKEEEKVREKVASLMSKKQLLNKQTVAQMRERDKNSRTCHQAKLSEWATRATLDSQMAQLREEKKALVHLQQELADFAEAYKLIKNERNHTHSQIQQLQQLTSEMTEKWRILQNEADVLTASAQEKDKLLQRCGLVLSTKSMERDADRQVVSKMVLEAAHNKAELEAQRESLAKLTHQVSSLERELDQMRKNYEIALQERNDAGLQLIERNEEVCVFHERLNMQEAVLRQASLDLMARKDEIRYLNMEITQLKTKILVHRKSLPEQSNLQLELQWSQRQLSACEEELKKLEARMENARDPSRVRLLPGPQVSQDKLLQQLESLEGRLAGQEQAGLEKELLYEQICRLTERVKTRTSAHRESTLHVGQRVQQYQSKIRDITSKTMALVSELTMQQANALWLGHEVRQKEAAIERAYQRLEAGQPPDEAIEQQWKQMLREEGELAATRKARVAAEESVTVEHRPNAYLPTAEGELPLPKPYGSHAPFKPSQPGANMRHIRKPQPKPIDI